MKKTFLTVFLFFLAPVFCLYAQKPASYEISLPGQPFGVVTSKDDKWIFVSLANGEKGPGLAVLRNNAGQIEFVRTVPMSRMPSGMVLTHKGDTLIVAAQELVMFFDPERLETGEKSPAFQMVSDGMKAGSVYVNVTADDRTLFVSDEAMQRVTVIDLERIRSFGRDAEENLKRLKSGGGAQSAIVGKIPVGISPVALIFSKDERWLFTTSQVAPTAWGWPSVLEPEDRSQGAEKIPEGAVIVVDVAKARTNPKESVVAKVPAGGSPVRLALSPDGSRLLVAARNSNAVLVFDVNELIKDPDHAKPVKIPVEANPVPVVFVADGKLALAGNSNRYGDQAAGKSTLTVFDFSRAGAPTNSILGKIPCGAFPREFHLTADGKTLYLTNFRSQTLQVMDVSRLMELVQK